MAETAASASPAMIPRIGAAIKRPAFIEAEIFSFVADPACAAALRAHVRERPADAALLAALAGYSPFLKRLMRQHPEWLLASLQDNSLQDKTGETVASLVAEFGTIAAEAETLPEAMQPLRLLRSRIALHIALMDCSGRWPLQAVMDALTATGDAAVRAALEIALGKSVEAGRLAVSTEAPLGPQSGIVVLALGKHGAGELNYSSDIDLIVLFDPERVPASKRSDPLDLTVRVVQDIVTLLDREDADGRVFRVDLRLRPDPASTPLAISIDAAFNYYETLGQNWERAALIKARPIAGDLKVGADFLADLRPFIWRKYFDYAAIADIHAMKRQIHAHKGHEAIAVEGHDIKLGRGGIREIEFFVQTQQLIYGGRRPHLRGQQTLFMLDALQADGWIGVKAVADLSAAYIFLRTIEHRLQMVDDEQTQRLPRESDALDAFAGFCGFTPAAFRKALLKHLGNVQRHYAGLFEDTGELDTEDFNFAGDKPDPETVEAIGALGFARAEQAVEIIRGWHFGRRQAVRSARARETLSDVVPMLLIAFSATGDPDAAIAAFDDALSRMPAAVELLSILKQNRALLALFAELLGSAPRLAEIIAKRPHVLDILLDPEFVRAPDGLAVEARIAANLSRTPDFESFLNQARELAYAERFLIGARVVSRLIDPIEAGRAHTIVAEAFLRQAAERVSAELRARYGPMPGGRVAVLGFGKLGSSEMTAASDLDLVILYDTLPDAISIGERPLTPSDYYSRYTQRLITALSTPTGRGVLYEIDLRLRPSGRKGPVATSLAAFCSYHEKEAETWEHMALTRVRAIAGDASLCDEADSAIAGIIARPRDRRTLARDVVAMRRLIAAEKGDDTVWDIKLARGGLLDIEFAAQFLTLAHGAETGSLGIANTRGAIDHAVSCGQLGPDDGTALVKAWQFHSGLTQLLRVCLDDAFDPDAQTAAFKGRIALAMGLPDFRVLTRQLTETQKNVRTLFNRIVVGD